MSEAVELRPTAGLLSRLRAMDHFGLFLSGFIVLYGLVSIGIEQIAGIVGFAKTPYLNAGSYAYALAFLALSLLANRVRPTVAVPHPLGIAILASVIVSALLGLANQNAPAYILAWSLYIASGLLMYQLFRNRSDGTGDIRQMIDGLYSLPFLGLMLVFALLSVFNKDNHYQYVLFEVIALYGVLLRPSLIEKALCLALYGMIHLGSNDGFVQVEINRASILAIGAVGLAFLLYRRYLVILIFLVFASVGGLFYALSLDDQTIDLLPRNIKEAIMLMKGDDIYNHVSSYQRIYEGQKVMEDFESASDAELLFGMGLGRTVDMSGAADRTVGQHALLGVTEVHNIHFLHYAVLHKFGMAGLAALGALAFGLLGMFAADLAQARLTRETMFFYVYLIYNLVFAVPASNFLIANPLWPAFLGMLVAIRHQTQPSAVLTERPLAL